MELNMFESKMLKDAVVEYWHTNMKNSKNERVKNQYRCMMEDIKTITNSNSKHSITINN